MTALIFLLRLDLLAEVGFREYFDFYVRRGIQDSASTHLCLASTAKEPRQHYEKGHRHEHPQRWRCPTPGARRLGGRGIRTGDLSGHVGSLPTADRRVNAKQPDLSMPLLRLRPGCKLRRAILGYQLPAMPAPVSQRQHLSRGYHRARGCEDVSDQSNAPRLGP